MPTYSAIASTELDAESPITDTVTAKIVGNFDYLKAYADSVPVLGHTGYNLSLDTDTNHDVSIAAGAALDTTGTESLKTTAAQIKQLDVRFAVWPGSGVSGGLANAAYISASTAVSFDNATSKIIGTGLFETGLGGATIIVSGSSSNDGIHEITASTANDATLSVAPTTEAAGASITVYIIRANWQYNVFLGLSSGGDIEIGFDDDNSATNFLSAISGTKYRAIGYITTNATANLDRLVWIGDRQAFKYYPGTVSGSATTATYRKPAMLAFALIELCGGGEAGDGVTISGPRTTNSGGSGAWGRKYIPAADIGDTETVTSGQGGVGSTSGTSANGGTSSFGSHCSTGGGPAGAASGCDVAIAGENGQQGDTSNYGCAPKGGGCRLGEGGIGDWSTSPGNGYGFGSGGGGGATNSTSNVTGGDGGPGLVIVHEWFQ